MFFRSKMIALHLERIKMEKMISKVSSVECQPKGESCIPRSFFRWIDFILPENFMFCERLINRSEWHIKLSGIILRLEIYISEKSYHICRQRKGCRQLDHLEMRLLNLRIDLYLLQTFYPHLGSFFVFFVLFLLSLRFGQISPLAFFRWFYCDLG